MACMPYTRYRAPARLSTAIPPTTGTTFGGVAIPEVPPLLGSPLLVKVILHLWARLWTHPAVQACKNYVGACARIAASASRPRIPHRMTARAWSIVLLRIARQLCLAAVSAHVTTRFSRSSENSPSAPKTQTDKHAWDCMNVCTGPTLPAGTPPKVASSSLALRS